MTFRRAALAALVLTLIAPAARAETPPPAATPDSPAAPTPPAGYAPPPAGYAATPPDYAPPLIYLPPPPPGYHYVPAGSVVAPGPSTMPYKDGYPIPDGYHPELRMKTGLVIAGAVTFGALYSISAASAATSTDKSLFVPILGPFLAIGQIDFHARSSDGGGTIAGALAVFAVIDGLGQLAGTGMLLVGLTQKSQVLVRKEGAKVEVRVTPLTMGYGGTGIGLVGTM